MKSHKSFSILEILFSIIILTIIASIAIPKLINSTKNTSIIKAKNDLNIILNGLKTYKDKIILQNLPNTLDKLDNDNKNLFSNILDKPFISSSNKQSYWSKLSNITYLYWIDSTTSVQFNYKQSQLSFTCDKSVKLCQDIIK